VLAEGLFLEMRDTTADDSRNCWLAVVPPNEQQGVQDGHVRLHKGLGVALVILVPLVVVVALLRLVVGVVCVERWLVLLGVLPTVLRDAVPAVVDREVNRAGYGF
jgi:hypothetical protein